MFFFYRCVKVVVLNRVVSIAKFYSKSVRGGAYMAAMDGARDSMESVEDDIRFGFKRIEMYKKSLAGTVDPPYDRHVFLSYKGSDSWPSRLENSSSDPLPSLFSAALKSRKDDLLVKTRFTIFEDLDGLDGNVLIFPEMIKYSGLSESDIDEFVDDVLVEGKPWRSGAEETLNGSHVFVCSHTSRDRRCGVCGPVLMDKLKEEIIVRGWKNEVFVNACSHIGGHKYAGNLIIFSPFSDGIVQGHWYGYMTPNDIPELLDQHIGNKEIVSRLWRGRMGGSPDKQTEAVDEKKANGVEDMCCGGRGGGGAVSCCQERITEGRGRRRWVQSWDRAEVLTAVAVVGAFTSIGLAYSLFRRPT